MLSWWQVLTRISDRKVIVMDLLCLRHDYLPCCHVANGDKDDDVKVLC